jgi:glycosyltransferase involved in cell wall biosynthesis
MKESNTGNEIYFSVIIPTYNRQQSIFSSIDSALAFIANANVTGEIIVIDDASSDQTITKLKMHYGSTICLIESGINVGVTAARMLGVNVARGHWLIMLDSDDTLLPDAAPAARQQLEAHTDISVAFFRCQSMKTNKLLGLPMPQRRVKPADYLSQGLGGECLTIFKNQSFRKLGYDKNFRAFEEITNLRQIRDHGDAWLSDVIARRYDDRVAKGRLSGFNARLRRADEMARGFILLANEFQAHMTLPVKIRYILKAIFYRLLAHISTNIA